MKKVYRHNKFTAVFSDEDGYFSLTGEVAGLGGAVGDTIAKTDPRFQLLEDMHLNDCKTGAPMHALENAFYHYKESGFNITALEKYWRVELAEGQKSRLKITIDNIRREDKTRNAQIKDMVVIIMTEIAPIWKDRARQVYEIAESIPLDLTEADESGFDPDDFDEPEKVRALAALLEVDPSIIEEDYYFEAMGRGYYVLTDDEANEKWDECLESYIDDCILPECPESVKNYFDREAWKEDAEGDGRGHSLSGYDGLEYESDDPETKETFYIYRQN